MVLEAVHERTHLREWLRMPPQVEFKVAELALF